MVEASTAGPFAATFDAARVREIAARVAAVAPRFDTDRFARLATRDLESLGMKARSAAIARALADTVPGDARTALDTLARSLEGGEADGADEDPEAWADFGAMPVLDAVPLLALGEPDVAFDAMARLTRRFSAEFAVRPFLARHPDRSLERLGAFAADPDWRLRRLASEGTRPRLPWGARLARFVADPAPTLALIGPLHDDPHPIVRRSVSNHLNDVSRDHPALAVAAAARWTATGTGTARATVRHGLRTLEKAGHPEALRLLGYGDASAVEVRGPRLSHRIARLGDALAVSARLRSTADAPAALVVDFALERPLARGGTGRKVFKLAKCTLAPGETREVSKALGLVQRSTRTWYPGAYAVELLVNGEARGRARFELADG